jgi:methanogenic corrinoid protein MtbC1
VSGSVLRNGGGLVALESSARAPLPGWSARRSRPGLAQTIESHILPRLVVRRALPTQPPGPVAVAPAVAELATLAMQGDDAAVRTRVRADAALHGLQHTCMDLLAPASRHLGALWDDDLCSFTDVTLGVLHLQEALRRQDVAEETPPDGFRRHRIALASAPGEHHRFGLDMVGTSFRQAGWCVTLLDDSTLPDLAALLRRAWFGVLGISVGSEQRLERLAAVLPRLRDVSRNASLNIIVGGAIFVAHPELAAEIGADGTAADAAQAVRVAENLLAEVSDSS